MKENKAVNTPSKYTMTGEKYYDSANKPTHPPSFLPVVCHIVKWCCSVFCKCCNMKTITFNSNFTYIIFAAVQATNDRKLRENLKQLVKHSAQCCKQCTTNRYTLMNVIATAAPKLLPISWPLHWDGSLQSVWIQYQLRFPKTLYCITAVIQQCQLSTFRDELQLTMNITTICMAIIALLQTWPQ
jgi:hypothetical protein